MSAPVNWLLMLVTIGLTIGFGKSDNLAAAYGIAVSLTMLMTTMLLFIAMREIWRWSLLAAGAGRRRAGVVDAAFVAANLMKIADGGYVPLLLAAAVYGVMLVWHLGAEAVAGADARRGGADRRLPGAARGARACRACPGTAVFLTRTTRDVPPVMVWHVRHNRALHERVFILNVTTELVPYVPAARAADRRADRARHLARRRALRLHGAAGYAGAAAAGARATAAASISPT